MEAKVAAEMVEVARVVAAKEEEAKAEVELAAAGTVEVEKGAGTVVALEAVMAAAVTAVVREEDKVEAVEGAKVEGARAVVRVAADLVVVRVVGLAAATVVAATVVVAMGPPRPAPKYLSLEEFQS